MFLTTLGFARIPGDGTFEKVYALNSENPNSELSEKVMADFPGQPMETGISIVDSRFWKAYQKGNKVKAIGMAFHAAFEPNACDIKIFNLLQKNKLDPKINKFGSVLFTLCDFPSVSKVDITDSQVTVSYRVGKHGITDEGKVCQCEGVTHEEGMAVLNRTTGSIHVSMTRNYIPSLDDKDFVEKMDLDGNKPDDDDEDNRSAGNAKDMPTDIKKVLEKLGLPLDMFKLG